MAKVHVYFDEWYPVPGYEKENSKWGGNWDYCEVPQNILDRYDKAEKEFSAACDELTKASRNNSNGGTA